MSRRKAHTRESLLRAGRPRRGQESAKEAARRGAPDSPAVQAIEQRQRDIDRAMASAWLRTLGVAFRRSGKNPLFAWDAWRESRHSGLPLPDWAAGVLDRWATGLNKLARDPGTVATEDASQALGLAGSENEKSAFFLYRKWLRDRDYMESVAELLGSDLSLKVPTAVASVADREGVSRQTVSRACERMLKAIRLSESR